MPENETTYDFLNGLKIERSRYKCRGCFMNKHPELFPNHLAPIMENDMITIRQDAEFPVPAFYVIGLKAHVHSIADVDFETASTIGSCIYLVRKAMKEILNIQRAQIYLEEKLVEPHYHTWLLPIWPEVIKKLNMSPRIWENNIRKYIEAFEFENESARILDLNEKMREALPKFLAHLKTGWI